VWDDALRALRIVPHERYDAVLLQLIAAPDARPIPLVREPIDASWTERLVQLAGAGRSERGTIVGTRFAVERIAEVTAEFLLTDGEGRTGACDGDSGGPLLVRQRDGSLAVAGLLKGGPGHCRGLDQFTRADLLQPWVAGIAGLPTSREPCGDIDAQGICRDNTMIYCADGALVGDVCGPDRRCAYDRSAPGFRCTTAPDPSCGEIDDLGVCENNNKARRCVAGELQIEDCGCARNCSYDPHTGKVACADAL
jgi:hypothetical protein